MLRSGLASHSLLYSAEVDGVDSIRSKSSNDPLVSFIELKTSKVVTSDRADRSLRKYKLMKWWSQAYLTGIPRVVCGFRDDYGIVRSLQTFEVTDMPSKGQVRIMFSLHVDHINLY